MATGSSAISQELIYNETAVDATGTDYPAYTVAATDNYLAWICPGYFVSSVTQTVTMSIKIQKLSDTGAAWFDFLTIAATGVIAGVNVPIGIAYATAAALEVHAMSGRMKNPPGYLPAAVTAGSVIAPILLLPGERLVFRTSVGANFFTGSAGILLKPGA